MKIKTFLSKYLSVLILIGSIVVLSAGCEKKTEKPGGENVSTDTTNMAEPEQPEVDTTKIEYPDLTGTWTGSFESHTATFKITGQDGSDFNATLNVAYRQPMNKSISGVIDPATNKITMKDDVKSRYEATYTGKLSDDMKKITGTAHFIVDGNNESFTFTKK